MNAGPVCLRRLHRSPVEGGVPLWPRRSRVQLVLVKLTAVKASLHTCYSVHDGHAVPASTFYDLRHHAW